MTSSNDQSILSSTENWIFHSIKQSIDKLTGLYKSLNGSVPNPKISRSINQWQVQTINRSWAQPKTEYFTQSSNQSISWWMVESLNGWVPNPKVSRSIKTGPTVQRTWGNDSLIVIRIDTNVILFGVIAVLARVGGAKLMMTRQVRIPPNTCPWQDMETHSRPEEQQLIIITSHGDIDEKQKGKKTCTKRHARRKSDISCRFFSNDSRQ